MTQYSGKIIRKNAVVPTQQSASGVWTVTDAAAATRNNAWPVAGVPDPISRSVRFRSSASAWLTRPFATPTNSSKWTMSMWVKRGSIGSLQGLFGKTVNSSANFYLAFDTGSTLTWTFTNTALMTTTQVFRDPSAWYHVVAVWDSANATASLRARIYINGVEITAFSTDQRSSITTGADAWDTTNTTYMHAIGAMSATVSTVTNFFDGYMTEVNFIDGQALAPSSFGTTDPTTGAWVPMAYTGAYGVNGVYLNFKDNTSTTTLGYDYSGNGNNWTANNISLTAGSTYDSMLDVPTPWIGYNTDGGVSVTRGNYAVVSPLDKVGTGTVSDGNLKLTGGSAAWFVSRAGFEMTSGKWYWEVNILTANTVSNGICLGVSNSSTQLAGYGVANQWVYNNNTGGTGRKSLNAVSSSYGITYVANDVVGVAFDADAGSITCYVNNSSQGVMASSGLPNPAYPCIEAYGTDSVAVNFGQRPFSYTPPTGYKALCTTNLPEPTIKLGASYMAASTYTGTGGARSIVNSGNNTTATTFQPDFVWLKDRASAGTNSHQLFDSVRGGGKRISSNNTDAETTNPTNGYLSTFNTDGFSSVAGATDNFNWNNSGTTYVAWQWKANGAAVSNTDGTITSSVNAGTTQGFSVVTYTGSGAAATVGHGLGVAPKMIIVKRRDSATNGDWFVYTATTGNTSTLYLNLTNAVATGQVAWNSTTPTSTVFSIGNTTGVNASASTYVAYCFAEVAGYSKFGTFTGNGSADGPFVYLGFRPRYILMKRSDGVEGWIVWDTSRNPSNVMDKYLAPNTSGAEGTSAYWDANANGMKLRVALSSGATYIYMAFAENPFKYSNAR